MSDPRTADTAAQPSSGAPDPADPAAAPDTAAALAPEQRHLTMLYERLDELRRYTKKRLSEVLLQTGGTPQARSERESFTQLYTEDLAKFDAAEHGLCFGRIDVASEGQREVRYIGRMGILDEEGDFEPLLLDWRAPLARPFYLATAAAPDGVLRRRHIRSRNRAVTALYDEYLDPAAARAAGAPATDSGVGSENALLAALDAARTEHMTDIVATIQHEQDAIIRSEHKSVLVVQGGPGTGKTAVALHRAAYLLYTHRQQLARSGVLLIGPNSTFLDYIGQVLPSLGETGVLLSTIGDLYPGVRATGTDSRRAAEFKGSLAMVNVLKQAVRDRQTVPTDPVTVQFDGYPVTIDRSLATKARGRARSSRRPHNLAKPIFAKAVIDGLTEQLAKTMGTDPVAGNTLLGAADLQDIAADMRADPTIGRVLEDLWPTLEPQRVLRELWCQTGRLDKAGRGLSPEDRKALSHSDIDQYRFTPADAPLLDELAELVGIDDAADRERARRRWHNQLAEAREALDILAGSAPQDLDDEFDAEILMAYDVVDAEQLAHRQHVRDHQTTAERAAGDRTWTYGHVIIDEAQELSPMAWRMVMRRIPNRWITAVGDIAQTSDPAGAGSWQEVFEPYVAQRWKSTELSVNYRTPAEIMAVAGDVLADIDPAAKVPLSIRATGTVPRAVPVARHELGPQTAALTSAETGPGTVAVITPGSLVEQVTRAVGADIRVMTVAEAKGLEFDAVYVVEPAAILGESPRGRHDLYVALTRATQRLTVLYSDTLPSVLRRLTITAAP